MVASNRGAPAPWGIGAESCPSRLRAGGAGCMTFQSVESEAPLSTDPEEVGGSSPSAEMREIYEQSLRDIVEGDIVKGTILEVRDDAVLVDIGYKSEGLIPLREFRTPSGEITVKVGDA